MYEVFINHHSLILSNSVAKSPYTQHDYNKSFNWADFIKNIPQKGTLKLWVKSDDIESSWSSFKAEFELIVAAGGLVKKHQDYLFIYRNGKWDLPKGKLENNEDVAECAVIGIADKLKGQLPIGLLALKAGVTKDKKDIISECIKMVREKVGPVAAFKIAIIVKRLPKTRSGKVLRGTVRKIADNEPYKMPATIDDPAILDEIKADLVENKILKL